MANTVVVTVTRDADWLIFDVGQGAEDVRKLPSFKDTRFKIRCLTCRQVRTRRRQCWRPAVSSAETSGAQI